SVSFSLFFFFYDPPSTEIYTLSLHDALPIFSFAQEVLAIDRDAGEWIVQLVDDAGRELPEGRELLGLDDLLLELPHLGQVATDQDRKSTRLNSSHVKSRMPSSA